MVAPTPNGKSKAHEMETGGIWSYIRALNPKPSAMRGLCASLNLSYGGFPKNRGSCTEVYRAYVGIYRVKSEGLGVSQNEGYLSRVVYRVYVGIYRV